MVEWNRGACMKEEVKDNKEKKLVIPTCGVCKQPLTRCKCEHNKLEKSIG